MIEDGIRGGMCQSVHRHVKANNKYMKNYNKSTESSYLIYLDANNLYGWAMFKKLPINGFEWENDVSRFNESFIKNYNKNSDVGYFLEVDIEYPKKLWSFIKIYHFYLKEKKIGKVGKLVFSIEDKQKICNTHKSFKTSIKSWISIKRCS